jgi:uncharacterized protein (DUF952 family)
VNTVFIVHSCKYYQVNTNTNHNNDKLRLIVRVNSYFGSAHTCMKYLISSGLTLFPHIWRPHKNKVVSFKVTSHI